MGELTNQAWCVNIERLKENGTFVNKANITACAPTVTTVFNQTCKSGFAYPAMTTPTNYTFLPFSTTSTNIQETIVGLGWHFPYSNGWGSKLAGFFIVPNGQIGSPNSTVTINVGGTNRTFVILAPTAQLNLYANGNYNGLMLYE